MGWRRVRVCRELYLLCGSVTTTVRSEYKVAKEAAQRWPLVVAAGVTAFVLLCCCCVCCAGVALCRRRRRRKGGRYRAFDSDDPVEEVELGKRSSAPTKASSLPAASNLPPAERPSSDDAGSAEEWEARDGGGFELRINS